MSATDLDAYRGMNYEIAEAIAPTWTARRDDIERISEPVREWLLREVEPAAGDTVLELAAGTGDTGFAAAELIGPEGQLICSDFSPTMLEGARRRGEQLEVANADYEVIDAEQIELEDDSVDRVLCRFGYMLMADPPAAFAETRRVLRAGGRLALAVWGPPERNPFFTTAVMSLIQGGHMDPPEPGGPGLFSLGDPERLAGLLEGAGFGQVRVEEVPVRFEIPSSEEYVRVVGDTAGGIALTVQGLDAGEREALAARAAETLEQFAVDGGGYSIPGVALCATAG
jgi:SAM-dependent methyltransferase